MSLDKWRQEIDNSLLLQFLSEQGVLKRDMNDYLDGLSFIQLIFIKEVLGVTAPSIMRFEEFEDLEFCHSQAKKGTHVKFQFVYAGARFKFEEAMLKVENLKLDWSD